MTREKLGIDSPPTIRMIVITTSNSARVNPVCEARPSPDLARNFTLCRPSRFCFFAQTYPGLNLHPSKTLVARGWQNSDVARSEFSNKQVTFVDELSCRTILTQTPEPPWS